MKQAPQLEYAVRTDVGQKRELNEDYAVAIEPCFLVADGMGGHEAGDLASRAAITAFTQRVRRASGRIAAHAEGAPPAAVTDLAVVHEALDEAREAVAEVAFGRDRGAGCTLSGVVLVNYEGEYFWFVLNIGDSRVYLHRGAELRQLTVDHSLRDEMIAAGAASSDKLPSRNIITRALGSIDTTADTWLLPVETGARLLVCSDGLTTEVSDEELRATLTMGGRAEAVAEELVERANAAGGRDNITAIVVDALSGGRSWHVAERGRPEKVSDDTLTVTIPRERLR